MMGSYMKRVKKVKWDPIIAKLANNQVKQEVSGQPSKANALSGVSAKWVAAAQKRESNEEFQAFLKQLFDRDGPKVKYQNPDAWRAYPVKKNADASS
jgi:hypothetical protein